MDYKFELESGTIIVTDLSDNNLIWKGKPNNHVVKQIIQTPEIKTCIALLDPDQKNDRFHNLVKVDINGFILWEAELPDFSGVDCYVDVKFQDDFLVAHSWAGFKVIIDIESGQIVSKKFTK